ncbi:MAG: putative Ig domain-containing protein [Planctomycetes bacterium]|jgi:hypothetical protein|nr:putative Ig domain-containing protein [Planctomycetota bacterium]MCL4731821.1 putative Ig domain-containing protein [Planctomycetota bacterium]
MKARAKIRLGLALAALTAWGVVASGLGSSTNFTLDDEATPAVAQNAYSPGFRLVGAIPTSASGDVGISAQYRLHFDDLTPVSFLPDDLVPPVITVPPVVTYISDTIALVEWQTDEPSDGVVQYGLTPAFGSSATHSGFATLHQVVITGLSPSTFYFFRAGSTDPYANGPTWSTLLDFTTAATPDTTGPVVTPTVTILATTVAQVDFSIDEMSQTTLHHGPTAALGTSEADLTWVVDRTRTFTGLTAGGSYFYALDAVDPSGNLTTGTATAINLPADVAIATSTLPAGQDGSAYTATITATGGVGTVTFAITAGALPAGMTLDPDGTLSGTPMGEGLYQFTVEATDSGTPASVGSQILQLQINKKPGKKKDEGCSTGEGNGAVLMLAAWLALVVVVARARRPRVKA